jgi:phospholipid transport system substrate-binding protein
LRSLLAIFPALLFYAGAAAAAETAASGSPVETVEKLHAALLSVMKDAKQLGYAGRYERLAPVLKETYDSVYMAEKSVGRHWQQASPADQTALVDTFSRFMIANYAGRFDKYSGQSFEIVGEEPSVQGTMLVRTRLINPKGENVQLNYRLHPVDGRWKIIDVYLNGTVSELALRRSEYVSTIRRDGWKALIVALDERIQTLASAPGGSRL